MGERGIIVEELVVLLSPFLNLIPLGLIFFIWRKYDTIHKGLHSRTTKEFSDETFQRKDLCEERSGHIQSSLDMIEKDIKKLLERKR